MEQALISGWSDDKIIIIIIIIKPKSRVLQRPRSNA